MYKKYYFNNNADEHGYHEIHTEDCHYLPALQNQIYIGEFSDCSSAFMNASIRYPDKNLMDVFTVAVHVTRDKGRLAFVSPHILALRHFSYISP